MIKVVSQKSALFISKVVKLSEHTTS